MIKRILIGIISIAALGGALVYYFLNKPEPIVDSVFRAVPLDAALLIDIKDYQSFHNSLVAGKSSWDHLSKLPLFDEINQRFQFVDSLNKVYPQVKALLSGQHPVLLSGHPTGRDEMQFVYYIRVDEENDFKQFDNLIHELEGKSLEYFTRKYEGVAIHDISFALKRTDNFSYAWSHGLLMLSKSSILLEKVVRQLSAQESLLDKPGLNDIVKTAGKTAVANFYLNFDYFPSVALKLIQVKYGKELRFLKNFGSWIELDLDAKPDFLTLNGFSTSEAVKPGFEALFRDQKPQKLEIFNKIPSSVSTFAVLGISKLNQYLKDYDVLLDANGLRREHNAALKNAKDNYNLDLANSFNDIFEQEAGIVFLGNGLDTLSNQAFSIIRTKSSDDAEKILNGLENEYATKNNMKVNDLIFNEKIGKDKDIKIWSLPHINIPVSLFGGMFSAGSNKFCSFADNYMIFASNRDALLQYLKYLDQNATIGSDLEFNSLSEFISTQSNFFFYNKPSASMGFYSNFFKSELMEALAQQQTHLNSLNSLIYQFSSGQNGLIYHNLFIRFNSNTAKTTGDAAKPIETQLDGKVISKPFVYKVNKETAVFVQDDKNQVYLINNPGRMLWKVQLSEPIISDIVQIDFYKNGKQQLLFNTRTKLYILDRNGNNLEKFPITLAKPATNGLAVVDYDKNRDYRIFIAGTDHKIYLLDKKGEPVEQWNAEKTESDVTQPVQHFRAGGKDYLVYSDRQHLYVVNRKGKEVVKAATPFQLSENNKFALINPKSRKEVRFVMSEANGKVVFIGLDGKVKESDFGKIPENHWFDVYDVNDDGVKDFVFTWDTNLKVFSQDGKMLQNITTNSQISYRPMFYEFSKDSLGLGIVTGGDNKVYFYNKSGNILKGFPLKGNTQFTVDIFKNSQNRFNLMVGSENNLLFQYSVQ